MSTLCQFWAAWEGWMDGPFGSAFEGHGCSPPVNTYMCILKILKDDIRTYYFLKVHANSPL